MTVPGIDGTYLDSGQVVDRVESDGAFLAVRGGADSLLSQDWMAEVVSIAKARGLSLGVRDLGRVTLLFDQNADLRALASEDSDRADAVRDDDPVCERNRQLLSRARHPSRGAYLRLVHTGPGDVSDDEAVEQHE